MNNTCLFIVEDEPSIAETLQFTLEAEGFDTRIFSTGRESINALSETKPALILLDVGLADGSGFDFFREIRAMCDTPIIYITARSDEIDRVVGLEMGAEDYIVKPFSLRELVARVRVVLRRVGSPSKPTANSVFNHDLQRKKIHYHQQALDLTLHEYRLLETLLSYPERVFTRAELLERGWDAPDHRLERTIDSHIKTLRNKLRSIAPDANPICTHRGMGYSLDVSL